MADLADGFVTYSDGVTDDVNKVIWNACGGDTEQSVEEILVATQDDVEAEASPASVRNVRV